MPYPFLPVEAVETLVPTAKEIGISEIARSPKGFVPAYLAARDPDKLTAKWHRIRENFIRRNVEAAAAKGESWWVLNVPTKRHLALVMWAYSPDSERMLKFISGLGK